MKTLTLALLLIPLFSLAQEKCEPVSPEMNVYLSQKKWVKTQVQSKIGSVAGYITEDRKFYFSDLSRHGQFQGTLFVDTNNLDLEKFNTTCQKDSTRAKYLQLLRKQNRKNRYTLEVKYLPEISGFSNDPIKSQSFKITNFEFELKWDNEALSVKEDYLSDELQLQVRNRIAAQLRHQPEIGVVKIDLTNLDDVACDFALGNVKLSIRATLFSTDPLIEQEQRVSQQDISLIMENINSDVASHLKEKSKFIMAGKTIERLERDRRIQLLSEDQLTKIVEAAFEGKDSSCVSDQMQKYKVNPLIHRITMDVLVHTAQKEDL